MSSDYEIGRVVAVDTAQVTIELSGNLKALTRATYEETIEVGRINSYIVIPVGARRIVAMVTRVVLMEEGELKADKTMVSLPSARRLMKATMIGTIDESKFRQGISLFPVLDSPVLATSRRDLDVIFGKAAGRDPDSDKPGFCIPIGKSAVFPDYDIRIDPDAFFGKHAAIIGSTGSGKSCTIATILQSILEQPQVRRTRFIILDTNGEYRTAFQKKDGDNLIETHVDRRTLSIPTDPNDPVNRLVIPYWFMDSEDYVRIFRAAPGVQRPVLLGALSMAREMRGAAERWVRLRTDLILDCNRLLALARGADKTDARAIRQICDGWIEQIADAACQRVVGTLQEHYLDVTVERLIGLFSSIQGISREGIRKEGQEFESYAVIDVSKRTRIESAIEPILGELVRTTQGVGGTMQGTADRPSFYSKQDFRYKYLDRVVSRDEAASSRARDNCATMLMRIIRLFEDSRFDFLFGPTDGEWPEVEHALATFIRDLLGMSSGPGSLSTTAVLTEGQMPFYDRQRTGATESQVVIVDLSLLAAEVLENVTALIGRLIHEFLQRISDPISGVGRGDFPVVLVLEEAQNYIHDGPRGDEEPISKVVFERIAREGRKYGLGLVIASQRPSELSRTALSQCNSFIVHRLQNPEDLRYFREIVPGIFAQLLDQLPALAQRNALVLGECIQAPALVEMREANPTPKSKDPKFYRSWVVDTPLPDVEAVCAKWEGRALTPDRGNLQQTEPTQE